MKISEMTTEQILKVLGYQTIGAFIENEEVIKAIKKRKQDSFMEAFNFFTFGVLVGKGLARQK